MFGCLAGQAANDQILGWNNLGMHCMDSDYSVFSILPPYNTIECQLLVGGVLVTNGTGYRVTYQAVPDPDGSFNSTAVAKGNFYTYCASLYGPELTPDSGLAGWSMPGISNAPQAMRFETTNQPAAGIATLVNWFRAEGIPISPYDDALRKNPYSLMRLIAWNAAGQALATNDIVLPVSDEMDCRACHASGSAAAAQPAAGWVWDGLPERDFRLNILRLHDERQFALQPGLYTAALAARGFNAQGLYRNVTADAKPVLCALCHASEALGLGSYSNTPPLTASIHGFHAHVADPQLGLPLESVANRAACYRCHPGSTTRCLRGAMGTAVTADGTLAIQCQDCHGTMSRVGSTNRVGWFMEPTCQSCHTGSAATNRGQLRFTSVFSDTNGTVRTAADPMFATQTDSPAPGLSLYRFSAGHGGLQCEACHGSTHAEFPSSHRNDNLRNLAIQGHAGVLVECTACHPTMPDTPNGGPHGLHNIGQGWVTGNGVVNHADWINALPGGVAACVPCHGTDFRGTVLSRAHADRTLVAGFDGGSVVLNLFRGALIGCYTCHLGPGNDNLNSSPPPTVANVSTNTTNDQPVSLRLPATGSGLTLRIISQPANGTVGLSNTIASYFPNSDFVGTDTFTYAAYDGSKNSNLGTGSVSVARGMASVQAAGRVPPTYPAGWPAPFTVSVTTANTAGALAFDWDFGDGSSHGTNQTVFHAYANPGVYLWTVRVTVDGKSAASAGLVAVGDRVELSVTAAGDSITVSWSNPTIDTLLEETGSLEVGVPWTVVTNVPAANPGSLSVTLPTDRARFFRVVRPW
ncbi:MAG: PKD domain-containing protein [Verrucomicrobia bacterium]|nr:PKD domain-containing protein [Verrucomicrobiota bacterium]